MKSKLLFFFLLIHLLAFTQKKISGVIVDIDNNLVFAANVYCKDQPTIGSVTGLNGEFLIPNFPDDSHIVKISCLGYETLELDLRKQPNKGKLKIILNPSSTNLSEVILNYENPISKRFSVYKMDIINDVYLNPTAQGDPLKAITVFPSSTTEDESASISLRGSNSSLTQLVINDVPLNNPVRSTNLSNQGLFSILNPSLITSQNVYASNPPLTYGNTGSGLIEIETTKQLNKDNFQFSLGLLNASILASKKINKKSFVQLYSNYIFSDLYKSLQDEQLPTVKDFSSNDLGINYRNQKNGKFSFNSYNYFLKENFNGLGRQYNYLGDITSDNKRFFSINTLDLHSEKGMWRLGLSYNFEEKSSSFGNNILDGDINIGYFSLKHKTHLFDAIEFETGLSYQLHQNNFKNIAPITFFELDPSGKFDTQEFFFNKVNHIAEVFTYSNWKINNLINLAFGLRTNVPTEKQDPYLSAQTSLAFSLNTKNNFLFSVGNYNAYNAPSFYSLNYNLIKISQVSFDYTLSLDKLMLKAATYYKREKGEQLNNEFFTFDNKKTAGLELYLKYHFNNNLVLSLSNSYINQTYEIFNTEVSGDFDFDYFLKSYVLYNFKNSGAISLSYVGRPGLLYNGVIGGNLNSESSFEPKYDEVLYNRRFNNYERLDVSYNRIFSFNKFNLIGFVSLNNLLNKFNQNSPFYNYDYSQEFFNPYSLRVFYLGCVFQFK